MIADGFAKVRELGVLSFSRGPRPKPGLWILEMRRDLVQKRSDRKIEDIGVDLEESLELVVKLNYKLTGRLKATRLLDIAHYFFYFTSGPSSVIIHSTDVRFI